MQTETVDASPSNVEPPGTKWWIPIGLVAFLVPLAFLVGIVAGIVEVVDPGLARTIVLWFVVGAIGVKLLAIVAVYFDRQYVAEYSEWTPSRWYYLVFVSAIGLVLSAVYVYRRHKYVGVP